MKVIVFVVAVCVLVLTVLKEMLVCVVTEVLWLPTAAAAAAAASALSKYVHVERYKVRQMHFLLHVQI